MISEKIITKDKLKFLCDSSINDNYKFRERRHDHWTENYTLYRDKVTTNRLTQTQSVNIPLMKQTIKTLLSKTDDFVVLNFTNNDNDKQKEIFYNAYWDKITDQDRLDIKDIVDKKQVFLYGRSFKSLNIINGEIKIDVCDPFDISVDRYVKTTDLDSAKSLVHSNIYTTLADLELNDSYDKEAIKRLREYFETEQGLIKASENAEQYEDKLDRLKDMGDDYADNPMIGQTVVALQYVFQKVWNPEQKDEEIIFNIMAEGELIYSEFLETVIGITEDNYWRHHYPYTTWADDIENTDFWSDGVADSIRTPNKVLNSWFSQMIMNRTLRNLGMTYYNSTTAAGTDGAFVPQTYEPKAFGFYPVPGNPTELLKNVEVPQLIGNLDDMNFVIQVAEKASAATAITQGVSEQRKITLGEVELLASNASDRIQSMSKFYIQGWKDTGIKYTKLIEAAGDGLKSYKLYKKGYKGNIFAQEVGYNDWKTASGYSVEVTTKEDEKTKNTEQLQNLNAAKQYLPMNQKLAELIKKKILALSLDPEEVQEVMDEESKTIEQNQIMAEQQNMANRPNVLQPENPELQSIQEQAQSVLGANDNTTTSPVIA